MQSKGQAPPNAKGKGSYPGQVLTADEVAALVGQCSRRAPTGIRNRTMITLMYKSGLRVSEALGVRAADIDMDTREIRLQKTKSGTPQVRWFHRSADDAMARWIDTRKQLGLRNGRCTCSVAADEPPCTAHLFCTLDNGPVSDRYIRDMMKRNAAKAGIDHRVHPHALRHSFAWDLAKRKVPVAVISKLMGHSSIAITARYLDHLTNGEAGEALAAIDLPEI